MAGHYPEAMAMRGSWERDPSHFPLPLTPAFASVYLPWQEAALSAMFSEFGYLAGSIRTRLIDGYLYISVVAPGGWTPPPWLTAIALRLWWVHPAVRARVRRGIARLRTGYPRRVLRRWGRRLRPRVERELRAALATDLAALSDRALAAHIETWVARTAAYVRLHFRLHGAIAPAIARLEFFCRDTPELHGLHAAGLVAGLSGASAAPGRELRRLADLLRDRPETLAAVQQSDATLRSVYARDADFAQRLQNWIDAYGHRITARYEFIEPALAEQPDRLLRLLARLAGQSGPAEDAEIAARRAALVAAARARLSAAGARRAFDDALAAAADAYPVRDDNVVLTFNTAFAVMRYALLEAGRRWQGRRIERVDDIFFFTIDEIVDALRGGGDAFGDGLALHAAARRRAWERRCALPPPPLRLGRRLVEPPLRGIPRDAAFMTEAIVWYLRGIQSLPDAEPLPLPELPASPVIRGIAAAGGRYRGVARVLHGEADFERFQQGEVLVCPVTSPAWSPLFPLAGALVTDHGGALSHPAVIAREFGIPAVVATGDATRRIADGTMITVDGDRGEVVIEVDVTPRR